MPSEGRGCKWERMQRRWTGRAAFPGQHISSPSKWVSISWSQAWGMVHWFTPCSLKRKQSCCAARQPHWLISRALHKLPKATWISGFPWKKNTLTLICCHCCDTDTDNLSTEYFLSFHFAMVPIFPYPCNNLASLRQVSKYIHFILWVVPPWGKKSNESPATYIFAVQNMTSQETEL